jgi:5'-nucleotidase
LVLSGVNRGQNVADDITVSGTIAAAMEGTALGIKSIALSQVIGIYENGTSFAVAATHGEAVVRKLLNFDFGAGNFMNVNFPDCRADEVAGIDITMQGKRDQNYMTVDERADNRGSSYFWLGFKRERGIQIDGTDLAAVFQKRISVTPLHANLTQHTVIENLKSHFA